MRRNDVNQRQFAQKLHDKSASVAVLGMGYVGLPLAVVVAEAGFKVVGIDPDERKLASFERGISYIQDVPSETVRRLKTVGALHLTTDFSALRAIDAVSICVPTPLRKTGDPDMSYILSAVDELARFAHPGMVVVLESTTEGGGDPGELRPFLGRG